MRRLAALIWFFGISFSLPLSAMDRPVVVELFTSQGCSSCPPADALIREMANNDDVIVLALHVDYWDYIGWKDTFAQREFTHRQKKYAIAMDEKMIYTPQIIIDGEAALIGNRTSEVTRSIEEAKGKKDIVSLEAVNNGKTLSIAAQPLMSIDKPTDVYLVEYLPEQSVSISRGENSGRTIVYANVVHQWENLGNWSGQGELALTVPYSGQNPAVVLLQQDGFGPIIAAARVE